MTINLHIARDKRYLLGVQLVMILGGLMYDYIGGTEVPLNNWYIDNDTLFYINGSPV